MRLRDRPWFTAVVSLGGASVLAAVGVLLVIGVLGATTLIVINAVVAFLDAAVDL